ncbi:hypothetical protein MGYG_02076 [Nannizzia gypsea CBS 118893]|uniref:BZIP domain-containing protein n=1 Tax=Arthroderma gypseum (strain ATCC MYA-4604 / CBS 118893) TaxID=535722 RepID=E4UPM6_ARTGP|nr:hypothetical protein MGYG_02076 [Nannizzia gypsea CBS 118893]EFQ99063.1 hypothetical protein MGYG_02076 [Nannizzia gypsea CBS 118893]
MNDSLLTKSSESQYEQRRKYQNRLAQQRYRERHRPKKTPTTTPSQPCEHNPVSCNTQIEQDGHRQLGNNGQNPVAHGRDSQGTERETHPQRLQPEMTQSYSHDMFWQASCSNLTQGLQPALFDIPLPSPGRHLPDFSFNPGRDNGNNLHETQPSTPVSCTQRSDEQTKTAIAILRRQKQHLGAQTDQLLSQLVDLYQLGVSLDIFPFDSELEDIFIMLKSKFGLLQQTLEASPRIPCITHSHGD